MARIGGVGLEGERGGVLAGAAPSTQRAALRGSGLTAPVAATAQLLVAVEGAMARIGRVGLEGAGHRVEPEPAPATPITLRFGSGLTAPVAATAEVVVGGTRAVPTVAGVCLERGSDRVEPEPPARASYALKTGDRRAAPVAATAELDVTNRVPVTRIRRIVAKRR